MSKYKLIGTDGKQLYSWLLEPGNYTIGRKSDCDFCINNSTVSRRHAEMLVTDDGGSLKLVDLGSHNGTIVNGQRLIDSIGLNNGDRILFGESEFKIAGAEEQTPTVGGRSTAQYADHDPEKSVFLSINEVRRPLPAKVTDLPEVLPTIFEMAKVLVLPEPQERMLEHALALIARAIPAGRLAVLLKPEGAKTAGPDDLRTAATILPDGKDPGSFTLSRTIVDDILSNKTSLVVVDARTDPRFAQQESIIMSEMRSAMAVPLFDEDDVLGILYVDTTNPMHRYTDDYLHLLATFGNIVASRLNNFRLLEERQEKEIIENELRRASAIQKNLLTKSLPCLDDYSVFALQEQCRAVGGDLYDLTVLPNGSLLFILADVSGKGTGAALLMSNILASFRILYTAEVFQVLDAVKKVNSQLFQYSAPDNFATLFVGLLEPTEHRLTFINAGHNPPMLIRADGSMTELEASGPMIGAFDFSMWSEASIDLNPGDTLAVFTDGVTEAERGEELYGEDRLETYLSENRTKTPSEIATDLVAKIDEFIGDGPRTDDITLLVLKREK